MTIYAIANEQDSITACPYPLFGTNAKATNADYCPVGYMGSNFKINLGTFVSECWIHMRVYRQSAAVGSTTLPVIMLHNSTTGKDAFRIYNVQTSAYFDFKYNNSGTAYTTITSGPVFTSNGAFDFDLYFKRGTGGVLKAFGNNTLAIHATGTFNTVNTTWDTLILSGMHTTVSWEFGNIVVGDMPLFAYEFQTLKPTAAGAVSGWTGDYTTLQGVSGMVDTSTAIHTNSVADAFTMSYEDMITPAPNLDVKAVGLAAGGSIDSAAAISNIALYARYASINYTLNSVGTVKGEGPFRYAQVLEQTPASTPWSEADVNSIEFGGITS
jgi:hypothetical protein